VVDEELVRQYRQELERLARRLCRNPHDAEDVTQNALLKAVKGFDDFRGESTVKTWLHRITTNECLMMRRKKTAGSLDELTDMGQSTYEPEDPSRAPDELAMVSETQTEVLAALDLLPEKYRNTVMLVDGCGMSYEEVAGATDTSVAAVRSTLFRARKALRRHLAGVEIA
jgi:RNA polymerase sigma-70 factor (ECF subfamily)